MASITLYPPTLNSIEKAFIYNGKLRLEFSLSKLSSSTVNINGIQFAITKQSTGNSVVNTANPYGAADILIWNLNNYEYDSDSEKHELTKVEGYDNLYYVEIDPKYQSYTTEVNGEKVYTWEPGVIYKIQIRLSEVYFKLPSAGGELGAASWLVQYAGKFSEWSTYCTTKAILVPEITVPAINAPGSSENPTTYGSSTLRFSGSYDGTPIGNITEDNEYLYSYRIKIYKDNILEEDSGIQYTNAYANRNNFDYLFGINLENKSVYRIDFTYTTLNLYTETISYYIKAEYSSDESTFSIYTIDADITESILPLSIIQEEDQGIVTLGLSTTDTTGNFTGHIYIVRASSRDNFKQWDTIYDLICNGIAKTKIISQYFYDLSIESGVWYKYGIQTSKDGINRTALFINDTEVIREFNSSFLLGYNQKQLRLPFDNTMNSYKYTYSESKIETIGGQFPIITRNGNLKYRTFPVNGLISFNIDQDLKDLAENTKSLELVLFLTDEELYNFEEIADLYKNKQRNYNSMYNMTHEREFREKVLNFLQDGKPKLFKSPTEGNILIRLMDINFSPNQTVDRLIGSFSATAYEVGEATMTNIKKYKLINTEQTL